MKYINTFSDEELVDLIHSLYGDEVISSIVEPNAEEERIEVSIEILMHCELSSEEEEEELGLYNFSSQVNEYFLHDFHFTQDSFYDRKLNERQKKYRQIMFNRFGVQWLKEYAGIE